ncbi:MAG: hypothetical protein N2109_09460 [Fimbriimonadales bacterium]|nr:hypothetical protein [Fimbriimonadales bacterium]
MKGKKILRAALAVLAVALAVSLASPAAAMTLFVLAVAALFAASVAARGRTEQADPLESARPEDRATLRKLQRMRDDIASIVRPARGQPSAAIRVVGEEALAEADRIVRQVGSLLGAKRELRQLEQGRYEAEREASKLEERLAAASEAERPALEAALRARRDQAARYAEVSARVESIAASIDQAELALSEIKARLATAATAAAPGEEDSLRETLGRVRALGRSLDEAKAWMEQQS